jgi:hypothetical protein
MPANELDVRQPRKPDENPKALCDARKRVLTIAPHVPQASQAAGRRRHRRPQTGGIRRRLTAL